MKTLTKVHEEQAEKERINLEDRMIARKRLLESSASILPLEGRVSNRLIYRELLKKKIHVSSRNIMSNVACDNCKTELVFKSPDSIVMSYPPRRCVVCVGCGFSGHLRLNANV
jgi:hypothetical protein